MAFLARCRLRPCSAGVSDGCERNSAGMDIQESGSPLARHLSRLLYGRPAGVSFLPLPFLPKPAAVRIVVLRHRPPGVTAVSTAGAGEGMDFQTHKIVMTCL